MQYAASLFKAYEIKILTSPLLKLLGFAICSEVSPIKDDSVKSSHFTEDTEKPSLLMSRRL